MERALGNNDLKSDLTALGLILMNEKNPEQFHLYSDNFVPIEIGQEDLKDPSHS